MKNYSNKVEGDWGEENACRFLEKKGYKIISRNYKTKFGEIDIICRQNNILVFVEVKTRTSTNFQRGIEAINISKIQKIQKTALLYLQEIGEPDCACRFDVIVIIGKNNNFKLHHIESAF